MLIKQKKKGQCKKLKSKNLNPNFQRPLDGIIRYFMYAFYLNCILIKQLCILNTEYVMCKIKYRICILIKLKE